MARRNKEFFTALELLEKEKGIPMDFMIREIKKSISIACKKYNGNDDVLVTVDKDKYVFEVSLLKKVVEEVVNPKKEISLEEAKNISARATIGEKVGIKLNTKQFGRMAALAARNVIRQGVRIGEREQLLALFKENQYKNILAIVDRIDENTGDVMLKIGKTMAVLEKKRQIPNETFKMGQGIQVYVEDVREGNKGANAILSRIHPEFIKHLFERESPEILSGEVEIKSIAREAGSRTKISVYTENASIDPLGACIGEKSARMNAVTKEIGKERIDIIPYSSAIKEYIAAAISPAKVDGVFILDEEKKLCRVYVDKDKLSLAIGIKGQNARLAARLTGWKIDIKATPEEGKEKLKEIEEEIERQKKEKEAQEAMEQSESVAEITAQEETVQTDQTESVAENTAQEEAVQAEQTESVAENTAQEGAVQTEQVESIAESTAQEEPVQTEQVESVAENTAQEGAVQTEQVESVAEITAQEEAVQTEQTESVAESTAQEEAVQAEQTESVAENTAEPTENTTEATE